MPSDGCERGVVPPVGMAWGLPTIVDDELATKPVVYRDREEFRSLMDGPPHGRFCRTPAQWFSVALPRPEASARGSVRAARTSRPGWPA